VERRCWSLWQPWRVAGCRARHPDGGGAEGARATTWRKPGRRQTPGGRGTCWRTCIKGGGELQPLEDTGGMLQSSGHVSLLAGDDRAMLDGRFWHFLFGFGPGSLQKICSLMYTLQILYITLGDSGNG
jgi:hypothetical protein